jgi:hypothetical protein
MLNYSLPCSSSKNFSSFWLTLKQQWTIKISSPLFSIFSLVEGLNRLTYFWKRTIQWLFHQHLVLIEQMVSDNKILMGISHRVLC